MNLIPFIVAITLPKLALSVALPASRDWRRDCENDRQQPENPSVAWMTAMRGAVG